MIALSNRPSATIYQFPTRAALASGSFRAKLRAVKEVNVPRIAPAVCGSSWYHEAAIQEAQAERNR